MTEGSAPSGARRTGPALLKALFKLLLTGLVTWFILKAVGLSLGELQAFDWEGFTPRWGLLVLSCLLLLLGYLYSASLWGLMVRELGGPEVRVLATLRIFFTANLGRYLPGKVWQLAGLAYLAKAEGVTAPTATAAALLGQLLSLAGATLIGSGVLLGRELGGVVSGGWITGAMVALLVILTFPAILNPLLKRVVQRDPGAEAGPLWPDRAFGVRWLGLYGVSWILQGGAFWLLVLGLGLELSPLQGVAIFPAAYLLGYLFIFAPAGIGVREGFLIVFLNPIMGASGAGVAVAARLWTTLVELAPALLLAGGFLRKAEVRAEVSESEEGGMGA
jgi:uncharacterized membrane protein YbhN (UPF0104 family)